MDVITGLIIAVMVAVVAVLLAGVVTMARGGQTSLKYGNKLMRWRVILQGVVLLLLLGVWLASRV